jgi:SAM-dependent methyltransferase
VRILHLGCGKRKAEGAFGVDIRPFPGVDLVHDLDVVPYPLESDSFEKIIAIDVLEHLDDFVAAVGEIHRVGTNGAEVVITGPFPTSLYRHHDPTHRRGFTRLTMDYFVPGTDFHRYGYSQARFSKVRLGYSMNEWRGLLGRIILKFANTFPAYYERWLAHLFPVDNVYFILRIEK